VFGPGRGGIRQDSCGSGKIHLETEDFSWLLTKSPLAQAFQPVPAQAKACGCNLPEPFWATGLEDQR
jgi:hypothetical protein